MKDNKTAYRLKKLPGEDEVVEAYQKIESGVVGTYRKIEDTVVGAYQKVEDRFVERFLEPVGDPDAAQRGEDESSDAPGSAVPRS